ncbi:MAG: hypothetical protein ACOH2H_12915 [Cypionkella sp.]
MKAAGLVPNWYQVKLALDGEACQRARCGNPFDLGGYRGNTAGIFGGPDFTERRLGIGAGKGDRNFSDRAPALMTNVHDPPSLTQFPAGEGRSSLFGRAQLFLGLINEDLNLQLPGTRIKPKPVQQPGSGGQPCRIYHGWRGVHQFGQMNLLAAIGQAQASASGGVGMPTAATEPVLP